jgi:hypothetical protein
MEFRGEDRHVLFRHLETGEYDMVAKAIWVSQNLGLVRAAERDSDDPTPPAEYANALQSVLDSANAGRDALRRLATSSSDR